MSLFGPGATILSAASRTTMGRPNDRSSMQHWQQFLRRAHVRQMFVRFCRAVRSAFQRKMVKGRVQILHSCSMSVLSLSAVSVANKHDNSDREPEMFESMRMAKVPAHEVRNPPAYGMQCPSPPVRALPGSVSRLTAPWSSFNICTYGLSGKHFSQTDGKSVVSHPLRFRSCLIWGGMSGLRWRVLRSKMYIPRRSSPS
jgi:hypothetical protein